MAFSRPDDTDKDIVHGCLGPYWRGLGSTIENFRRAWELIARAYVVSLLYGRGLMTLRMTRPPDWR
jgi:hypothetical protein